MDLNINDYINLLQLLRRSNFVGLDEAAAGVQLAQKLDAKISALQDEAREANKDK